MRWGRLLTASTCYPIFLSLSYPLFMQAWAQRQVRLHGFDLLWLRSTKDSETLSLYMFVSVHLAITLDHRKTLHNIWSELLFLGLRALLASAQQTQPLPQTLSVLESTPQVRGLHTIIRYWCSEYESLRRRWWCQFWNLLFFFCCAGTKKPVEMSSSSTQRD